jgi:hypothetical protein
LTKVRASYNTINDQCTDGTLTIDKLEMILMCLQGVGEHPIIDLTTDTKFTPDQKEATDTCNLDIWMEAATTGRFGPTSLPHASTSPAVAAKDTTKSTTEPTSARSNSQGEQEYHIAVRESLQDGTKVTPSKDNNPSGKKRERHTSRDRRHYSKQQTLRDIQKPVTFPYPSQGSCKSITDQIMTTWVKVKYSLLTKEVDIHCSNTDNKRKALELIAALIGKTFPDSSIDRLLLLN